MAPRSGANTATTLSTAEAMSSANERNGLPAPAVIVVETGRIVARVACSEPATEAPSANSTSDGTSVGTSVGPAKTIAPDSGCTTVPAACSRLSTAGTLSPTKSSTNRTPSTISPGVLASTS